MEVIDFLGGLSMIRKLNRKLNEKVKSIFKEKYGLLRFYYYICDVRKSNPYKFTQRVCFKETSLNHYKREVPKI